MWEGVSIGVEKLVENGLGYLRAFVLEIFFNFFYI